jgi:hypothetical protein
MFMSKTLTFYFPLKVSELTLLVEGFQKEFDELINDTFSDDEMESIEKKLDALAAVYVNPILSEITFQDFDSDEAHREYFDSCKSTLLLENLPYLETNPFQVSWIELFLKRFSHFLVDRGNLENLESKEEFFLSLSRLKNMDALLKPARPILAAPQHGIQAPVLPIDFLILDVYKEMVRLRESGKITAALEAVAPFEKARRLFTIMKEGKLDSYSLLQLSALSPKDFDDHLEKLKFILKKL